MHPSNKFEEEYASINVDAKKKTEGIDDDISTTVVLGSSNNRKNEWLFYDIIYFVLGVVKTENINLCPVVNLDREIPVSPPAPVAAAASPVVSTNNVEIRNSLGLFE